MIMKKLMVLLCIMSLVSCRENTSTPNGIEYESPNEIVDAEPTSSIKLIERSEFIDDIGRIMVVEIQEHYYIILRGADRGHPIHAESCPKIH